MTRTININFARNQFFRTILVLLIFGLVVKDTSRLGDVYIIRFITQGAALTAGLYAMVFISNIHWNKYLPLWLYIGILFVSSALSNNPAYASLQVLSLLSVLIFFVAFHEINSLDEDRNRTLTRAICWIFSGVCILSLLAIYFSPSIVYKKTEWEETIRYGGLFGQSASMAGLAGYLLGCIWLGKVNIWVKYPVIAISLVNLLLTGTRTFIVASAIAILFQASHSLNTKKIIIGAVFIVWIIGGLFIADQISPGFNEHFIKDNIQSNQIIRPNSIIELGGRTYLWEHAFDAFKKSPFLGKGFTLGEDDLISRGRQNKLASTELRIRKYTLHNGYLQSLLDSGILGFSLYTFILAKSMKYYIKSWTYSDKVGQYAIIFVIIGNFGESFLFTAATVSGLLGWYFVIYGLSIKN